ncbi:NB-ARC domain containing protein [Parasponia andersonii]|uniref:NB-ARC domain containing protein n=1 Tax=Parasponia andersonii TaxID=3476 RepID=A0A2P5B8Z6_PARAD|nr:NB-ARC domain containing protein [Parasponia andersonii]
MAETITVVTPVVDLSETREEAYDIEDVMDEYLLHVVQGYHRCGIIGLIRKTGYFIKSLNLLASLFIADFEFLDVHSTRDELITRLVEGEFTRTVISLVDEGGVGKTTLAKQVYDNEAVKGHFDCRTWITVSQAYNPCKLLMAMKKHFCLTVECDLGEIDMMKEVISQLRQYLQTKRCMIVFDDVRGIDLWGIMRHALPNNDRGSRIVTTMHNDAVASYKDTSFDLVKKLQSWSQESDWELFTRKEFRFESEGHCPEEQKQLSLEIIRKCQRLPLQIAAVAGLLFEWQKYMTHFVPS